MKNNSYRILAEHAKESHQLQDTLWVPSGNIATVATLHRGGLAGFGGDLYYTDGALDALVRSAGDQSPAVGAAIYAAADRPWAAWRRIRPQLASARPLEAWLHLHETSREELAERGVESMFTAARAITTLSSTQARLNLVNYTRQEVAAAVRVAARDRLVRIAPRRIVIAEDWLEDRVVVRATWTALPAADRVLPAWMAGALDHVSSGGVE